MSRFIVYALVDSSTGEAFYVGKSHRGFDVPGRHTQASHLAVDANIDKVRRIARCLCRNGRVQIWPIAWARDAAELARLETVLIRQWSKAGVPLTNRTNQRRA